MSWLDRHVADLDAEQDDSDALYDAELERRDRLAERGSVDPYALTGTKTRP